MNTTLVKDGGTTAVQHYAPGTRVSYPRSRIVDVIPWIRSETLETHALLSDLFTELGQHMEPPTDVWREYLEFWASRDCVVFQHRADGTLVARHSKRLAPGEIWRLSLGDALRERLFLKGNKRRQKQTASAGLAGDGSDST